MKLVMHVIPGLVMALGSQLLCADIPGGNQALGQLDAIINYCSSLDPALQRAGQLRISAITAGASTQELADARASDDYRTAYDATSANLNGLEREQSAQQCKALGQSE